MSAVAGQQRWGNECQLGGVDLCSLTSHNGGVMHQQHLLPRIREACAQVLHGYLPRLKPARDSEASIVPPALGD
jgi:hypothetical protein